LEEDCTGGYDSDKALGSFLVGNKEEGEQDFNKNSSPVTLPVQEEEYQSITVTPEDETPCQIPIEDAVLEKAKAPELCDELKKRKAP